MSKPEGAPPERPPASRWHCDLASTPNLSDVERRVAGRVGAIGMTPGRDGRRLYFESLDRLAHFVGCSRSSAKRALRQLVRVGLAQIVEKGGGRNRPTVYGLRLNGAEAARARTWRGRGAQAEPDHENPSSDHETGIPDQPKGGHERPGFPRKGVAGEPVSPARPPKQGHSYDPESPGIARKGGQACDPVCRETGSPEARNRVKSAPKQGHSSGPRILESMNPSAAALPDGSGAAAGSESARALVERLTATLAPPRNYVPPPPAELERARRVLKVQAQRLMERKA